MNTQIYLLNISNGIQVFPGRDQNEYLLSLLKIKNPIRKEPKVITINNHEKRRDLNGTDSF